LRSLVDLYARLMVLMYPGVLLFWLLIHPNIEHWRRLGKRTYWIAGAVWPATWIPLVYFRREISYARFNVAIVALAAGIIAFVAALYIGKLAAKTIPIRTLVGLPELEPRRNKQPLLQIGIYANTRNPIYFAHWLLVFSGAALTGLTANWILFAADCIVLPLLIRAEERELLSRYGPEFRTYMRRVPRFFPKWTP
jgi:protein-S-isoprenylcysteine O-methyltransferase Ste14